MTQAFILITFLAAVVVLTLAARRLRIPYPIAFVVGGIALAFSRNLPQPHIQPDLILLLILPPLLYSAAWTSDALEFRKNIRPIALLAIGLVLFTTAAVAAFVHYLVPGFGWPLAFTLGAIVSPPDAVAAEAIFADLAIPRRIAAIITGECLFNDATALVLYRFALAAAVTGAFSLVQASVSFVLVAIGGAAIGVAIAFLIEAVVRYVQKRIADPTIVSVIFLLAPFVAYIPAEALHVSGVLAAVCSGLVSSRRSSYFVDSETRLLGSSVWRLLTFILNAFAFLLIGLELPHILADLEPHVGDYALYGLALAALVIVVRLIWVYPATYLPRLIPQVRKVDPNPPARTVFVIGWSGMRGIVSLAAALALPYSLGNAAFPERSVTIFFTLCVVFVTLVVQGLTLGPIIERLGVTETSKGAKREAQLRVRALEAGLQQLREYEHRHGEALQAEVVGRLMEEYQQRIDLLRGRAAPADTDEGKASALDRELQKEALAAERRTITAMRNAGEIPDDIFRSIEYDLDLAALRLA